MWTRDSIKLAVHALPPLPYLLERVLTLLPLRHTTSRVPDRSPFGTHLHSISWPADIRFVVVILSVLVHG